MTQTRMSGSRSTESNQVWADARLSACPLRDSVRCGSLGEPQSKYVRFLPLRGSIDRCEIFTGGKTRKNDKTHEEGRALAWSVEPTATILRLVTARVVQEIYVRVSISNASQEGGSDPPRKAQHGVGRDRHPTGSLNFLDWPPCGDGGPKSETNRRVRSI